MISLDNIVSVSRAFALSAFAACVLSPLAPRAGIAQSVGATSPVRVPFMRVLSASRLQVVASDQTSGQITLAVRSDRPGTRPPAVSIRVLRGTKEELLGLLSDPGQSSDTCILIQQALVYPVSLTGNALSIIGAVKTNWLAVDRSSSRFISTPYTLVIEEGEYQSDNAAALRIRRADLKSYLTRGLEVIIVPDKFATPAAPGQRPGPKPLTVTYLTRVRCQGYVGPTTAGQVTPARFAVNSDAIPDMAEAGVPTRLDYVAC